MRNNMRDLLRIDKSPNPLLTSIPLDKRLVFIKFFSQPTVYSSCDLNNSKRSGNRDLRPASPDENIG